MLDGGPTIAVYVTLPADTICQCGVSYPVAIEIARQMTSGMGDPFRLVNLGVRGMPATELARQINAGAFAAPLLCRSMWNPVLATVLETLGTQLSMGPPRPPVAFKFGINLSGPETQGFGPAGTGFPTLQHFQYWALNNVKYFRVLLNWQYLQSTVYGPLTTSYTGFISKMMADAATAGVTIFLNLANFGGGPDGTKIGNGTPLDALSTVWLQFSRFLRADPNFAVIAAYDPMNEWSNMDPAGGNSTLYSQSLVLDQNARVMNVLRGDGDNTKLYMEWDHYSGAWDSVTNNIGRLMDLALTDPARNSAIAVHNYLDDDGSGTHFIWREEIGKPGLSPPGLPTSVNIGVQRLLPVAALAAQKGVQLAVGETGWSNDTIAQGGDDDSADWNQAGFNLCAFCQANNIEITPFGAGATFPLSYMYNPEPSNIANPSQKDFSAAGLPSTQLVILREFSGYTGPEPTVYRADLPLGVTPFTPSGTPLPNFKMRYNGNIPAPITFTGHAKLADGTDVGGTFSSIVIPPGKNGIATFSYTPAGSYAGINLTFTNNRGLTNPLTPIGVSSLTDFFQTNSIAGASTLSNVFALWRMVSTYIGPAIRLMRGDGQQMDFYFNVAGNLPRQAIQDWAISRNIAIVTIYDQSLNANHMAYQTGNHAILNLQNAAGYPEIIFNNSGYGFNTAVGTHTSGNLQQFISARVSDANTGSFFLSQDTASGLGSAFPFRFNPTFYEVNANAASVSFGVEENVYHSYTGTFIAHTTNGLVAYKDGSVAHQSNTTSVGGLISEGTFTTCGYGGFNPGLWWNGAWTNMEIGTVALNSTLASDLRNVEVAYYSTALPDTLTAVPATVAGNINRKMFNNTSNPFSTIVVTDDNVGATDSVTITLTGASATLAGTGLSGSNPYTLAADTPANITTKLNALTMTSAASIGSVVNVAMSVVSSAGGTNPQSFTVTQAAYGIETAFAAPPSFTPVSYKGYNMDGAEDGNYFFTPTTFEMDYAASKGFGIIRVPVNAPDFLTAFTGQTALNTTVLNNLKAVVDYAASKNLRTIIDCHNFGTVARLVNAAQFNGVPILDGTTRDTFCDWCSRIASRFKNHPDNVVLDLMNEPKYATPANWLITVNQCMAAIRTAGFNGLVLIPGSAVNYFDTADFWTGSGNAAVFVAGSIVDPANNFAITMHEYLDSSGGGSSSNAVTGKGASCLDASPNGLATTWARANGFRIFLGEFGWAPDPFKTSSSGNMQYQPAGTNFATGGMTEGTALMDFMSANSDVWFGWTYFSGGRFQQPPNAGGYAYYIEPQWKGDSSGFVTPIVDQPQMAVLLAHL